MMKPGVCNYKTVALCCLLATAFLGCSEFSMWHPDSWTPSGRQRLRLERRYGASFPEKLAELKALRETAGRMEPLEQEKVCQQLGEILRETDNPLLRREITRTLGYFSSNAAADGLRHAMNDGATIVRMEACEAWGRYGGPAALEALATALGSDTEIDVRITAARELAAFPDPIAVRALGLALEDMDPALRLRAMESLADTTGRDFGEDLQAWQQFVQSGEATAGQPSISQRVRRALR